MSKTVSEILKLEPGTNCEVEGWVRTRRDSKEFSFFAVNDGSNLKGLQIVIDQTVLSKSPGSEKIRNGCSIKAFGELSKSPGKEQSVELQASKVELIGEASLENYPLQKKRHSNEFLRTIPHLRTRSNTFGAIFRLRSELSFAVHSFFKERGFYYIHTPIITTSDCEGAGRLFQATTLLEEAKGSEKTQSLKIDFKKDFFKKPAYLTVSGQLEAEALASSHKKVYTFGPTFRAENSNTARHAAEFWMVEPEIAFADLSENMSLAEDFIKYLVGYALENCKEDMEFFNQWVEKGIISSLESLVSSEFKRLPYTEAIKILEKANVKFEFPVSWGEDLQTEHERYLSEEYIKGPVFITNYPKSIKPFYMFEDEPSKENELKETVSAMDLLVPRLGEIIGGSQREHRSDKLKEKLEAEGMLGEMAWYQELRDFGTVPHSGFGLGFERLLMYVSGLKNIRDVIAFPRTAG